MALVHQIKVPHVGEGVKSVQIIRFMKEIGEWIDEDKDLVEIETDKSTFEIPSIASGIVSKILYKPGDIVSVGESLLEIIQDEGHQDKNKSNQKRRYEMLRQRAVYSDISQPLFDNELPLKQKKLAHNLSLSEQIVVNVSIEKIISFDGIKRLREAARRTCPEKTPSTLAIISYACCHAMFEFKKFRSQLDRDLTLREHKNCSIGIAISQQDGSLNVPSISFDALPSLEEMRVSLKNVIREKSGTLDSYHSLSISDMSSLGVHGGSPSVVFPAVATLFIGAPYFGISKSGKIQKEFKLCLAFDHRLINGAYAAQFISRLEKNIENLAER